MRRPERQALANTFGADDIVDFTAGAMNRWRYGVLGDASGRALTGGPVNAEPEGFAQFVEVRERAQQRTRNLVNGWIDHGHLVRLKPAGSNVFFEAW